MASTHNSTTIEPSNPPGHPCNALRTATLAESVQRHAERPFSREGNNPAMRPGFLNVDAAVFDPLKAILPCLKHSRAVASHHLGACDFCSQVLNGFNFFLARGVIEGRPLKLYSVVVHHVIIACHTSVSRF